MNIDEAINKAADHIEQYPESYHFGQGMVINRAYKGFGPDPGPGGPEACMLSRIGEMAGFQIGVSCNTVSRELLGLMPDAFYDRIRELTPETGRRDPVHDPETIPAAMRKIAKQYTGIPVSVRRIFEPHDLATRALVDSVEAMTRYRATNPLRPRRAGVGTIFAA